MIGRDDLGYMAGVAFGAAVLFASGYADRSPDIVMHNDFAGFWTGARGLIDGHNPYDPSTWRTVVGTYGTQMPDTAVYGYPGYVAIAFIPFALLPLAASSVVWTVLGVVAAVFALRLLLRTYCPGAPMIHTLAGLTLLACQPARLTVLLGQWGFLLLAASATAAAWLATGRPGRAGVSASLFLAKPQLFVAAAFGLTAGAFGRGHPRRFLIAALGSTVVAIVVSLVVLPDWPAAWRSGVAGARLPDPPQTTTTFTLLYTVIGPLGIPAAIAIVVVAAVLASLFRPRSDAWLAMWLAVSPVAAIYAWSYDHLLVLVPLTIATGVALRRSRRLAIAAAVGWALVLDVGTTALAVVAARRASESYSAVIPLFALGLVILLVWPERRWPRSAATAVDPQPR